MSKPLNVQTQPSNNTVTQNQPLTVSIKSTLGGGIFVTDDKSLALSLEKILGSPQDLPDNNKNIVENIKDLDLKLDTTKSDLIQDTDNKIDTAKQSLKTTITADVNTTVDQKLRQMHSSLEQNVDGKVQPLKTSVNQLTQTVSDNDTQTKEYLKLLGQDVDTKYSQLENTLNQEISTVNQSVDGKIQLESSKLVNLLTGKINLVEAKIPSLTPVTDRLDIIEPKVDLIDTVQTDLSDLETKMDKKVKTLESSLSSIEQGQTNLNQSLSTLENTTVTLGNDLGTVKQSVQTLDQKTDTLNTDLTAEIQKLDKKFTPVLGKIDPLKLKVEGLDTKLSGVDNKVDTNLQSIQTLTGSLSALEQSVQQIETNVTQSNQNVAGLTNKIQSVEQKITTLESTVPVLEQKDADLEQSVQDTNTELGRVKLSLTGIEGNVNQNTQEIQQLNTKADSALQKTQQVETELGKTKKTLTTVSNKVDTVENNLTDTTDKLQALEPKVTDNTDAIALLKDKDTTLEQDINTLEGKITPLTQKLGVVENVANQAKQKAETVEQNLTTVEQSVNTVNQELGRVKQSVTQMNQTVQNNTQLVTGLESRVQTNETKITAAEQGLQLTLAGLDTATKKITQVESTVNNNTHRLDTVEPKVDTLEQNLQTTDGKIDPLKQSLTALTQKVTGFEGTLNTVQGKVTDLESKDSDLEAKDTQIEQSVTALTQKVTTVEQTANSANQLASSLNGEVTTLKQTVGDHTQTLSQMETSLQGIENRVGQVETDLNNLTSTVDSNRQTLEQSIHDVNADLSTKIDTINNTTIPGLDTKIDRTKSDVTVDTNAKLRQLDNKLSLKIDAISGTVGDNSFSQFNTKVFKYKEAILGLDPDLGRNDQGPVYRIPSVRIGDDGVIHLTCDVRESGTDQERIEVVYARSFDGGQTWDKKVVGRRLKTGNNVDEATSRVMDPTLLYAGNGTLYILAGRWTRGSTNWTLNQDSKNNWDAALMIKSTDNGETWEQHTIGHPTVNDPEGNHIDVINIPSTCKGFLGGVDAGLRHSSGKLIFAIQFTKDVDGGCKSALLYSDDGIRWSFSTGATPGINYEPAIMELPDGKIVIHCRSEDPDAVVNGKAVKKAFITPDMGANFFPYSPLDKIIGSSVGSTGGHKSEGGLFANRTINGRWIIGACYPQNTVDSNLGNGTNDYGRNQITLYAVNPVKHRKTPLQMIYYKSGASTSATDTTPVYTGTPYGGYSALTYKACVDGEYLVCAYEDALGISIKNLSDLIPRLEDYCDPRERIVKDRFRDYYFMADTTNLPLNNFVTCYDNKGRYFSNFVVRGFENNDTITASSIVKNGYRFKIMNKSSNKTNNGLRSWIRLPMNATEMTVSLQIAFPSPLSEGITNNPWLPVYKFGFDQYGSNWLAGINLEIPSNGQNVRVELVRGRQGQNILGWPDFEYDRVYHMVVEYDLSGIHLYIDGIHYGSSSYDNGFNFASITSGTNAICFGGDWFQKEYLLEIGNFYVFMRKLTDHEKMYGIYKRSDPITYSSFETMIEINEVLRKQIRELQTEVRRAKTIAIYPDFVNVPQTDFLKLNYIPYHFKHNISKNDLVLYDNCPTYFKTENTIITGFGPNTTTAQNDSTSGYVTTGDGYIFIGRMKNAHTVDVKSLGLNSQEGYSVEYRWKIAGNVVRSQPDSVCFYMNPGNVFLPGQTFIGNGSFLLKSARSSTTTSQKLVLQGGFNNSSTLNNVFGDIAPNTLCKMMVVVNGRSFKIYIDGREVKSETLMMDWIVGQIGFIRNNNNQIFTGIEVHGLKAWNRALTPQEVQQMASL